MSQDLIEDFNSSPPSSPSMSSAYMLSSSPIPISSSPPQSSFQTPSTSPTSSPVKDTQVNIGSSKLSTPSTHHKFKNISMDGGYTAIPLSGFAGQVCESMASPDGSTTPLQHQASWVAAEDSSTAVALSDATTNAEDETGFSNDSNKEQRKLDSNDPDTHRLKSTNGIPHPKRPTIAAHRLQQKKLAKPFRSPVLPQVPKLESKPKASANDLRADAVLSTRKEGDSQEHVSSSSVTLDTKIKYRTTRAATQFKSPLSASNALDNNSLVRLTPTIQALERKLQILKRAVKVREDVQEEVLEGLVRKWTEAGREVAWEVWNLVKDNANSDGNSQSSKKRAFKGSWGWESPGDAKKPRGEEMERNWGWDVVPISSRSEEEEDASKDTLGTMLRQLGVAADTLGWDDEEGSFIDR